MAVGLFKDHATEIKVKVAASVIAGLLVATILGVFSFVPGVAIRVWTWVRTTLDQQLSRETPTPPQPKQQGSSSDSTSRSTTLNIVRSALRVRIPAHDLRARVEIRRQNGVAPIRPEEDGFTLETLPRGVFGFVDAERLSEYLVQKTLLHINMKSSQASKYDFEFHFSPTGQFFVVGAVDDTTLKELERPLNEIRLFTLYSGPLGTTDHMIGIPLAQLYPFSRRMIEGKVLVLYFTIRR
jgi:hypothetical protein